MTDKQREFPYTRSDFNFLRKVANERTGIVVSDDKYDMFYARLSRRVRFLGLSSFKAYCEVVRRDPGGDELKELVNAITTNLTAFFRENHHFEYLKQHIVKEHLTRHPTSHPLRIWSSGCSTGEEPYSLSISLHEALPGHRLGDIDILATDIDSNVLAKAASGVYAAERVSGIDKMRMKRWFLRGKGSNGGMVKLKPEIRRPIRFGQLNLMEDWRMEQPLDVIFCRNVIIYFDDAMKKKVIGAFYDNLLPGGYLVLGHSESIHKLSRAFRPVIKPGGIMYRKEE